MPSKLQSVSSAKSKFAYFYYVIMSGKDHHEGLRSAKKGLKCPKMTPFVRFGFLHRAVELAGSPGGPEIPTDLQEFQVAFNKLDVHGTAIPVLHQESAVVVRK
ncbi:hypothetical protein BDR07DRAFT_1379545 [Suillus spraguei]|nr:hypothetical protein BDR07DRAFT_1379545 [Suillus spraguei]